MAQDQLANMFQEFLTLYKVVNRKTIIDIIKAELNSEQLIEIYSLSDGEKSTREIASTLKNKCSHSTVAKLWNKWALLGLVVPAAQKGRYKAAFNLVEYGVTNIPESEEA